MNLLILAGIIIGIYYLDKKAQREARYRDTGQRDIAREPIYPSLYPTTAFPTVGFRTIVEFSTSTPVPVTYEPSFGKMEFTFNIKVEWKNVDTTWDMIIFMIGRNVIATVHPHSISGQQTVSVKVQAVPGGRRQIAAIVKNIEGIERIKAAAYEYINFGQVM